MRGNTERVASREVRARGGVPVGDADDERCFLDESRPVYPKFLARGGSERMSWHRRFRRLIAR
jgi:hypothetical protein